MNGKNSFKKSLRIIKSAQSKSGNPYVGSYMQVGNWRFEENDEGDLVVRNLETLKIVVLVEKDLEEE